jgi:hypothetical protein
MLDLAAGLLPQANPGLPGTELSRCGGHDPCSGEAEIFRRSDGAATARLSGGVAEGAKGPLAGGGLNVSESTRPDLITKLSALNPAGQTYVRISGARKQLGSDDPGLAPRATCLRPLRRRSPPSSSGLRRCIYGRQY